MDSSVTVADLRAAGLDPAPIRRLCALRCRRYLESIGFSREEAEGLIFIGWLVNTARAVQP